MKYLSYLRSRSPDLSVSVDGTVKLWQFNVPQPLAIYTYDSFALLGIFASYQIHYSTPPVERGHSPRLTKLRFNWNGTKFAVGDELGNVHLWRFDPTDDSTRPYIVRITHFSDSASNCSLFSCADVKLPHQTSDRHCVFEQWFHYRSCW